MERTWNIHDYWLCPRPIPGGHPCRFGIQDNPDDLNITKFSTSAFLCFLFLAVLVLQDYFLHLFLREPFVLSVPSYSVNCLQLRDELKFC
jgi:hypothetical protein